MNIIIVKKLVNNSQIKMKESLILKLDNTNCSTSYDNNSYYINKIKDTTK